jgi:RimJ/RimL family protein N-acetyltransferase
MSLFPASVTTERLRLKRLDASAVPLHDLYEVCAHDEGIDAVTEHVTWDPHAHPKETQEFVERAVEGWEAGEDATYVVRPREGEDGAGAFAGMAGLHPGWDRGRAELGTWLRRRFWGREYAGERAHALMAVAFGRLDLDVVVARCFVENDRSRRAIEKYVEAAGGRHEGQLRNDAFDGTGPRDVHRYSVAREEWRESAAAERPVDY